MISAECIAVPFCPMSAKSYELFAQAGSSHMPLVVRICRGFGWELHELGDPIFHYGQVFPGVRSAQEFDVAVLGILVARHFTARDRLFGLESGSAHHILR
jgi:hypothetical protein